jgi:hypothetical protein
MKIIRNTGTERVIDLVRPWLKPGHQLDMVTPSFSLFAFGEVLAEVSRLTMARLVLPPEDADVALFGTEADRAARNRLQGRWIAGRKGGRGGQAPSIHGSQGEARTHREREGP